jgi:4-diphosphocytidyl-2-C-methyl-D-erythritol kinase
VQYKSPAKINLALDILGLDSSGYHHIQTIFHEIPLHDIIEIKKIKKGIEIECTDPSVPTDQKNTAHKAIKLLGLDGYHIKITKNIPPGSGLGGGSSNAATILKALAPNHENLEEIATKIGMDVPFFLSGGTALGKHFGEKITPLSRIEDLKIDIRFSENPTATKEAYANLDLAQCGKNTEKTEKMIAAIHSKNTPEIIKNIHNDFAEPKNGWHLTGSGSARFLIVHSPV